MSLGSCEKTLPVSGSQPKILIPRSFGGWLCSGKDPLPGSLSIPPCCVLTWRKGTGSSLEPLFIRAQIPFKRASPSGSNQFPKAPPPESSPWGSGFNT